MPRKYELKRRAEQVEQTQRRIVEAAIELHRTLGPARTTVSAVAERARVQRQTYYRHFPDERSLMLACSGLYQQRNPLPDPDAWRAIADPEQRLRRGLADMYAYYDANEQMLANVIRDAQVDPLTRDIAALRMAVMAQLREALAEAVAPPGSAPARGAALDLALDFNTWQLLVRRSGLPQRDAIEMLVTAMRCL